MTWLSRLFARGRAANTVSRSSQNRFRPVVDLLESRTVLSGSPASLGAAGTFAVLEINGGTLSLNSSHLIGNIGQGPGSTSVLQKTDDQGTFFYDPTSTPDLSNLGKDFLPSGGVQIMNLAQAQADANAASAANAALAPTQTFGNVTNSLTVVGNGGTNVIALGSLTYNNDTLTLQGGANDYFVFNMSGSWTFAQSRITLSGGVTANHVIFNFPTAGAEVDMYKASNVINGTFLAPYRSVNYHNPAVFNGAIIGQSVYIHSDGNLSGVTFTSPAPPPTGTASVSGFVFEDANPDQVFGAGDFAIANVLISLYDSTGQLVATTHTGSTGFYSFTDLAPGTYKITESQPLIYDQGPNTLGSEGGTEDVHDTFTVTLGDGVNATDYNFGEIFNIGS